MTAKPILGYPSRTAAVQALKARGVDKAEICIRLGITRSCLSGLVHSANRSRARRPVEEHSRTVLFPSDVLDALAPHAALRGCTANTLARRIVATVVDDDMITAVLDDADEIEKLANG